MKHLLLTIALLTGFSTSAQVADCDVTTHYVEHLRYNYTTEEWDTEKEFWSVAQWEVRNEFMAFKWEEDEDYGIMWWNFSNEPEDGIYRYFTEKGSLIIINANDRYILQFFDWNEETNQYEDGWYFNRMDVENK